MTTVVMSFATLVIAGERKLIGTVKLSNVEVVSALGCDDLGNGSFAGSTCAGNQHCTLRNVSGFFELWTLTEAEAAFRIHKSSLWRQLRKYDYFPDVFFDKADKGLLRLITTHEEAITSSRPLSQSPLSFR